MLCLSGFELYSRWVPLFTDEILEIDSWTQQCTKRWVNGGGRGSYPRICTERITRIKIPRSRFTEFFEVKGHCMAGPVQNAAVC